MGLDAVSLVRRSFDLIWNEGRLELIPELMSPGYVDHGASFPLPARGQEGLRRVVEHCRRAFPDIRFTVEQTVAEGSFVVARWSARGTHQGDLLGISPTLKRVTVTGFTMLRVEDGKAQEAWSQWDTLGLLQQLGLPGPVDGTT